MITGPNDVSDMSFGLRYMFFFSIFLFFYTFYYYFRFDLYFESMVRARAGSGGGKNGTKQHIWHIVWASCTCFFLKKIVFFITK